MSVTASASDATGVLPDRPFVIGLTGPIAAGKSTVAAMLRDLGASVIDADQVYRSLLNPGSEFLHRIVARFGPSVVRLDGHLDRTALGKIVFRDANALVDLERITHPPVVAEIRRQIAASDAGVVVIEAVKLIESGLLADVDSLWLVTAPPEVRLRRLAARQNLSEADAHARLGASLQVAEPDAPVDVRIDNSGDMSRTSRAVSAAWVASIPGAAFLSQEPLTSVMTKETA